MNHAASLCRTCRTRCPLCAQGVPHHTNGENAISDSVRFVVRDIHAVPCHGGVELRECLAAFPHVADLEPSTEDVYERWKDNPWYLG